MFSKHLKKETMLSINLLALFLTLLTSFVQSNVENNLTTPTNSTVLDDHAQSLTDVSQQLNCSVNFEICSVVCNEPTKLSWSSTFCDPETGSCVCDCRDSIPKNCEKTPFTPCFQNCVRKNPNPDVYLYEGGNCPIPKENATVDRQCACECTLRDDYDETNDI